MRPALLLLIASSFCSFSRACQALTMSAPMVPSASVSQFVGIPTGATGGSDTFGASSVSYIGSAAAGAMSATTSASGGTDPSVTSATSFSGSAGPYTTSRIDADSELLYYFQVAGPNGSPVPVQLKAYGQATTSDNAVSVYASLDIAGILGNNASFNIFNATACAPFYASLGCNARPNAQQFTVNTTLQLTPNQLYEIVIETNIQSGSYSGPLPVGAFAANALVDPTLQLDLSIAGDYRIISSSNLAATPEPNSFILAATGAFAFATVGYTVRGWRETPCLNGVPA